MKVLITTENKASNNNNLRLNICRSVAGAGLRKKDFKQF
jgi:hypothetical protein